MFKMGLVRWFRVHISRLLFLQFPFTPLFMGLQSHLALGPRPSSKMSQRPFCNVEVFCCYVTQCVATSQSIWNVASVTKKQNFYFYFICKHMVLESTILDSQIYSLNSHLASLCVVYFSYNHL